MEIMKQNRRTLLGANKDEKNNEIKNRAVGSTERIKYVICSANCGLVTLVSCLFEIAKLRKLSTDGVAIWTQRCRRIRACLDITFIYI
jgi:hypothetical protein